MPPPKNAELPERVELEMLRVPKFRMPPPEMAAEFPEIVELVRVAVLPPALKMPPPSSMGAELLFKVELERVRVPLLLMPPPAPPVDMLPERVELVTVRMPELSKAPPLPGDFAPETVTPEMERLPPVLMVKILKPPAIPLMISEEAPGPVIAVLALIIVGNAAVKAMVPVTPVLKTISSLPGVVLARVMASLSEIPE